MFEVKSTFHHQINHHDNLYTYCPTKCVDSHKYNSAVMGVFTLQVHKEYLLAVGGVFRTVDQNFILVLEKNFNCTWYLSIIFTY